MRCPLIVVHAEKIVVPQPPQAQQAQEPAQVVHQQVRRLGRRVRFVDRYKAGF